MFKKSKKKPEGRSRGAYKDPESLISALSGPKHSLFAQAQLEGGFRLNDLRYIREKNLKGTVTDRVTGKEKGVIWVEGRMGIIRNCYVSPRTYSKIKEIIDREEKFAIDERDYIRDLYSASKKTNQDYQGSDGFRYNFARRRYDECLKALETGLIDRFDIPFEKGDLKRLKLKGKSKEEMFNIAILKKVAKEMGSHRPETVEHYL